MQFFLLSLGLVVGGGCAWWAAKRHESAQKKIRIKELESKLRYAHGQSVELKEKMAVMRGEMFSLQKTVTDERNSRAEQVAALGQSFKKGVLVLGVCYFAVGLGMGGTGAWFSAKVQTEAKHIVKTAQLEYSTRVADEKAEYYREKTRRLEQKVENLQKSLQEVTIDKEVLIAKFKILLSSMIPNKGIEGFGLDFGQLKKNLKNESHDQNLNVEIPILQMVKV